MTFLKMPFFPACLLLLEMLAAAVSPPAAAAWRWPWQPEAPKSVEAALLEAANVLTWKQHLRQREAALNRRDAAIQQQIQQQRQANLRSHQDMAQRELLVQHQFRRLRQASANREAALRQQLEHRQEAMALNRLQQGMAPANALYEIMQRQHTMLESMQNQQQHPAPPATASGQGSGDHAAFLQGVAPKRHAPQKTSILIFQAPPPRPVPTLPEPLDTRIHTTVNGIDRIETTATLPDTLQVPQLDAVQQIADNGVLIAHQRFALEQQQIGSTTRLARLRITQGLVFWGVLASIPLLLTLSRMVRKAVGGWRQWQREELAYKLKELEAVEGRRAMRETPYHSTR